MAEPASTLAAGSVGTVETQYLDLPEPVRLDCGRDLYPVRVAYKGDSPVEYWSEDDPVECEPFDRLAVTASWPRSARQRSEVASQTMNHDDTKPALGALIARSAELKRALVDLAVSPRYERHLARFVAEASDRGEALAEGDAINVIDRFALQYRLPNGSTVLDRFLADQPGLTAADREMLLGWRDPVEGIFEIRGKDRDSLQEVMALLRGADFGIDMQFTNYRTN